MDKHKIERICRQAGMRPETRANIDGAECFIADGFSMMPHNAYRRFGVESTDFPNGMYVTLWWLSRGEDKLDIGQPLFFDVFHDGNLEGKKRARINTALKEAKTFLERRKKARNGH